MVVVTLKIFPAIFCLVVWAWSSQEPAWPRRVEVNVPGDIILGALMMVHERANETLICGDLMPQGGLQAVEAMLYTIDYVNHNEIIPFTKLGARILDDCDKDTYGLQQAVHFIKGVIVYGSDQEVHGLMRAVRSENATGLFTWIGSDGWSARALVYHGGYEPEALGTISVQPMASSISGFESYFQSLRVGNNRRNPWFYEFWEKEFQCRYKRFPSTPFNSKYKKQCSGNERKTFQYEKQLQFVSDAVLVFAYGIRNIFMNKCGLNRRCIRDCQLGLIGKARTQLCQTPGPVFKEYIKNVTFQGMAGNHFSFYKETHDPVPNYNIIHFRRDPKTSVPVWVKVGTFTINGLELYLDNITFYTKGSGGHLPMSRCSEPCSQGHVKTPFNQDKCCWLCTKCGQFQYVHNETNCGKCANGTKPNLNQSGCEDIDEEVVTVVSPYGIICVILATMGTVFNTFILVVFVKHGDTPLVKASGRELSFVALGGLYLCFSVSGIILAPPSAPVCAVLRLQSGFCFVVVYAAILTKANRITRIFRSGKRTTKRPSMISPQSQVMICCCICFVQVLLVFLWFYAYPPGATHIYPTRPSNILVCNEAVENRYFFTYIYPIILCTICCFYAFKTRRMPEAFNESKYIGIAVYTTSVVWLAFLPVYILSRQDTALRVISICVMTNLSAYVVQIFMFAPKLWIILIRPEKNTRAIVMGSRGSHVGKRLFNPDVSLTFASEAKDRSDSSAFGGEEFELFHRLTSKGMERSCSVGTQTLPSSPNNPSLPLLGGYSTTQSSEEHLSTSTGTSTVYQALDSISLNAPKKTPSNQLKSDDVQL